MAYHTGGTPIVRTPNRPVRPSAQQIEAFATRVQHLAFMFPSASTPSQKFPSPQPTAPVLASEGARRGVCVEKWPEEHG